MGGRRRPSAGPGAFPYIQVEIGVRFSPNGAGSTTSCPPLDNSLKLREAIGQSRGTRLQNQGRFDFVEILVSHSRDLPKASSRHDALRSELLSAPRADDQVRRLRDHLISRYNTVLGRGLMPTIGEDVDAAGDLNELRDPSNSGD